MMEKFAIIHNLDKGQILITKEYDVENQSLDVQIQFEMEGARASFKIKTKTEKTANLIFEEFESKDYALHTLESFISLISTESLETAQQQQNK